MNTMLADAVSPVVLGGVALGFLVAVAIVVFLLLSLIAYVRKRNHRKNEAG